MSSSTDFSKAFQTGYSFQWYMADEGLQTVTFSVHQISDLVLTSGRIVVCDPLVDATTRIFLTQTVFPGRYPVILSVADFMPRRDKRIACAMLQICAGEVQRWENATMNGLPTAENNQFYGYGVDSGIGCFMDIETAQIIEAMCAESFAKSENFSERVNNEMLENLLYKDFGCTDWANLCVDNVTQANIITFSSGWGDGLYPSFWGYNASNQIMCLVTDFSLFWEEE